MGKLPKYKEIVIDIPSIVNTTDIIEEESVNTNKYNQWSVVGNDQFTPSYNTTQKLKSGFYEIKFNHQMVCHMMVRKQINSDELYELPSKEITDIIDDIIKFWENSEKYKQYKFVHKRGILLYGEPGCGKSGIIQLCAKHLIEEMDGIVINITDHDAVHYYNEFVSTIRTIEPIRPIIVILEDLDAIAGEDRHSTSIILNLLDGVKQIDNIVYIATTNYPEKLEERITNRPSRFDRRYEISMPDRNVRKSYIEHKLTKEDLNKIDIEVWLESTEGMSLAHMRELIISVMTMNNSFEDTIERLTGMKISPRIKSGKKVGFK
jgi:ATP-dependent 26S proteasome regulatory subunit